MHIFGKYYAFLNVPKVCQFIIFPHIDISILLKTKYVFKAFFVNTFVKFDTFILNTIVVEEYVREKTLYPPPPLP